MFREYERVVVIVMCIYWNDHFRNLQWQKNQWKKAQHSSPFCRKYYAVVSATCLQVGVNSSFTVFGYFDRLQSVVAGFEQESVFLKWNTNIEFCSGIPLVWFLWSRQAHCFPILWSRRDMALNLIVTDCDNVFTCCWIWCFFEQLSLVLLDDMLCL